MAIPQSARATSTEGPVAVPTAKQLAAWQSLYDQYKVPIGNYIRRLLQRRGCFDSRDHSLDVGQDIWLRAALSIHQCVRSPRGWLFRIARNTSFSHLKKCGQERSLGESFSETPEENERLTAPSARLNSPEELYLRRIIYAKQIERLSPEQFQVLQLRNAGFNYQEIFLRTGIPQANARQMIHRAKMIFRAIAAEEVH